MSVLVSGTVTDPSGVAEVKVNDIEVQVITDESFQDNSPIGLTRLNIIRVTATDTLGNQAFQEIPNLLSVSRSHLHRGKITHCYLL